MRTLTRKLLSLLLAFTMVCAMVPAAMAAETNLSTDPGTETGPDKTEETTPPGETTPPTDPDGDGNDDTKPDPSTCEHKVASWTQNADKKTHSGTCSICQTVVTENCEAKGPDYTQGESTHYQVCTTCSGHLNESSHDYEYESGTPTDGKHPVKCTVCGKESTEPCDVTTWKDNGNGTHSGTCNTCKGTVTESHNFKSSSNCSANGCDAINNNPVASLSIDVNGSKTLEVGDTRTLTVTAKDSNGDFTDPGQVTWTSSRSIYVGSGNNSVKIEAEYSDNAAWVMAEANGEKKTVSFSIEETAPLEVTINEGMGTYYFGDEDLDGDSLEDQLYDALDDAGYDGDDDDLIFTISDKSSSIGSISYDSEDVVDFGDVEFTVKKAGTYTTTYSVKKYKGSEVLSGTITIEVEEGGSAGDIIYSAKSGDDVEFDVDDFEDFWDDNSSKGSLNYVTFGSISSSRGTLVDADGDKVTSKKDYYVDPGKRELALDGVTFEPGRNTNSAVTIDFTAYGTNNKSINGTVVILYTEKDPEAIVYSSTGKNITLDADDFLDNYKDTMGSSASNIQIQFLEVPSNGTLYYKYNERTEKGTELTSKNVANYTFSTSSRASKSIEDVTYVPDSRGRSDTVRFACYTSGGDLRYYGEVTFGQTVQNVTVNMTSTSSGVTFQASTFFNADDALLSANTISFGTPSSGTLYKNWNGTSGTRVTASDMFSYVASVTGNASISTVTYVPVAGYSGTVTIPFSAYGAAGGIVSGTVSIRVTATTPTTIFTDVPTTGSQAWAYPFINRLAAAGVVSGVTPTTYGPKQTVKWGEALKMVLLGAGHPAQVEGTGSNWASGYLTYAVNNGIVSNTNINLSSNITRLEMAELAAKALGMSPASRINTGIVGPTDTTNGYVYALYNAGIVGGDSSSGQNRYNGGSTLLRDEMAKIVCGVMDNA